MSNKIAVIGAGISGVSIGKMLKDKHYDVSLFEQDQLNGGLIKCTKVKGHLYHKIGGHVFNSKNDKVLNWFWENFNKETEFVSATRQSKILLQNKYVNYPFENHIFQLEPNISNTILKELLEINANATHFQNTNFKEFLINSFGLTLFDLYFGPYNSKIWNESLDNIPLDWLNGKLPMPNLHEILMSNIFRESETKMVHSTFWYPKNNGSQFIIDRLSKDLNIINEYNIYKIEFINNKLLVNDMHVFDKIVYTGNVKDLINIINTNDEELIYLLNEAQSLKSNSTTNILCETDDIDISWLYIPDISIQAHRIIYTGNFSENNNPSNNRKSCVVEFSGSVSLDVMENEIKKLPGNLKIIDNNYKEYTYVIHDFKTREIINNIKLKLSNLNIHLLGRFAEWEYYNMDVCIEKAMNLSNNI